MVVHPIHFNGNSFFGRFLTRKAAELIPSKLKRMIYIGSCLGLILKTKSPSLDLLSKLNSPLRLANRPEAILAGVYVWDQIWDDAELLNMDVGTIREMGDDSRWQLSYLFAAHCPVWLNYGTDQLLVSDLHDAMQIVLTQS